MRRLPLYVGDLSAPAATAPPKDRDPGCASCSLGEAARTRCLPSVGHGTPGGLLVVLDAPSREEDAVGAVGAGKLASFVRSAVDRAWSGPWTMTHGVRCAPGASEVTDEHVTACRSYLAGVYAETRPARVLVLGQTAAQAMLGRSPPPASVRRGYGWAEQGVPVFFGTHPMPPLRNRILRDRWLADLEWALTVDVSSLVSPWATTTFSEVVTSADAADAVAALRAGAAGSWLAFDTETRGVMHDPSFSVLSVALVPGDLRGVFAWGTAALRDRATADPLRALLADPGVVKVGQNLKYDAHAIAQTLGRPAGCTLDTRLWRKLLESAVDARLEYQAELVGMGGHKAEALAEVSAAVAVIRKARLAAKKGALPTDPTLYAAVHQFPDTRPEQWAYGMVRPEVLLRYNARDALSTALVARRLEPMVRADPGAANIWRVLEGATEAFQQIEAWGIRVDRGALAKYQMHLTVLQTKAEAVFSRYPDLNPASVPSVRKHLYETLALPVLRRTEKDAPSTDEATLSALVARFPGSPSLRALVDHRRVAKLAGTYAYGLEPHVRPDGRIHPTFNLDGAGTGRLSCSEPNLQNIPRVDPGSEWGRYPRALFVPAPGHVFLQADYSQLELRVAAMLSEDEGMAAIFREGVDYHQRTAELIAPIAWGIRPEAVTKEHRSQAKAVNFGVLYGMTAPALAARMGCRVGQAEQIVEALFGKFRKLHAWTRACLAAARRTGEARTAWDGEVARRRDLSAIGEQDERARGSAENSAWNTPIQGTASDFCLASVVEVVRWLHEDAVPAKLVLTVHDSLLLEVRHDALEEAAAQVRRIMCKWDSGVVPLAVDLEVGPSWGDMHGWDDPVRESLRALGADPNNEDPA